MNLYTQLGYIDYTQITATAGGTPTPTPTDEPTAPVTAPVAPVSAEVGRLCMSNETEQNACCGRTRLGEWLLIPCVFFG